MTQEEKNNYGKTAYDYAFDPLYEGEDIRYLLNRAMSRFNSTPRTLDGRTIPGLDAQNFKAIYDAPDAGE